MLTYLNKGTRTAEIWSPQSVPFSRGCWEFMAILKGEACQQIAGDSTRTFLGNRLFVSPPTSIHTWHVREGESCEVVVLHADALPFGAQICVSKATPFSVPLSPEDIGVIQGLYTRVFPHYFKPRTESTLWTQQAILEICTIFLSKIDLNLHSLGIDRNAERSLQAVQYFREHLSSRMTVRQIAKAVHISTPQLRRIFIQSFNQSPKHVLTNIALDEACRLAIETKLLFKHISSSCGFAGFPQFYRAFRHRFGCSPNEWRRKYHPPDSNKAGPKNPKALNRQGAYSKKKMAAEPDRKSSERTSLTIVRH